MQESIKKLLAENERYILIENIKRINKEKETLQREMELYRHILEWTIIQYDMNYTEGKEELIYNTIKDALRGD